MAAEVFVENSLQKSAKLLSLQLINMVLKSVAPTSLSRIASLDHADNNNTATSGITRRSILPQPDLTCVVCRIAANSEQTIVYTNSVLSENLIALFAKFVLKWFTCGTARL